MLLVIDLICFYQGYFEKIDVTFYQFLASFQSEDITMLMKTITFFGSTVGVVMVCLICCLFHFQKGLLLSIHVAIVAIMNQIIKVIVARPRPSVIHLVEENSYSFPSAHAMVSMTLFGLIAYWLYPRHRYLAILILVIPIFIGMTRIYLGVHYTSDIIAGFLFSITYLSIVISLMKNHKWAFFFIK